jgi:hypothetical protein
MDLAAFEQVVLRVLFETRDPLTAPHLAYLTGLPVQKAERYLARLVEQGTVLPRVGAQGTIEYVFPGRRRIGEARRAAELAQAASTDRPGAEAAGADAGPDGDAASIPASTAASAATVVFLSVLVPGAGHIYAGRSGAGVAWMATTLAGYACCLLPGLFLHGLCLVSAAHVRQAP